jgi:hypothetical protein
MRNHQVICQFLAIFGILLSGCAPSPGFRLQESAVSTTALPLPIESLEPPSSPAATTVAAPESTGAASETLGSAPQEQQPYLLLATWKPKKGPGPGSIYPVDPADGQALPGYEPILLGENGFVHAYSKDRKRLAIVSFAGQSCDSFSGGSRCRGGDGELHLVELPDWQIASAVLPVEGFVEKLAFSSSNDRLALVASNREGYVLLLLDGLRGETIAQKSLDFPAELLAFTGDDNSLVVYGTPLNEPAGMAKPGAPRAALLDAVSLETLWEQEIPEVISGSWCLQNCAESHELLLFADYRPGIALSPDAQRLYLVHAEEDRLTTVDFAAQEVRTAAISAETSWFERLLALTAGVAHAKGGMEGAVKYAVLSVDGQVLYTTGMALHAEPDEQTGWRIEQESFPLQAVGVESGKLLASSKAYRSGSHGLRITPDGAYLVLTGWEGELPWSEVLGVASLDPVAEIKGWELQVVQPPDGSLTWLGSYMGPSLTNLTVLDSETFKSTRTWKEYGFWLVP